MLIRQGREGDEHGGRQQRSELGALQGPAGGEGALVLVGVLQRNGDGACLLAGGGKALKHTAGHQQDGCKNTRLAIGRQAADGKGRATHQEEREHQDESAAVTVTEGADDHSAEGTHDVGNTHNDHGLEDADGGGVLGEKDAVEHNCGGGAVDGEVVVFEGGAYPAGEGSSSW